MQPLHLTRHGVLCVSLLQVASLYKYLLDRQGNLVDTWSSFTSPESGKLVDAIERLL